MKLKDYDDSIKRFQGGCNCISQTNMEDEGEFSWRGCDIDHTDSDLGNTVYAVSGYNPETREVEDLGKICAECLCYIANADIPDFVDEED